MAKHNDLGKAGENAAVAYLEQKGYLIRDRNWRKGVMADECATLMKEFFAAKRK
jgi:hypothetical protein